MKAAGVQMRRSFLMPLDKESLEERLRQKEPKVNLSIRLRPAMKERIQKLADKRGIRPADVIDLLIEDGVPQLEDWWFKK